VEEIMLEERTKPFTIQELATLCVILTREELESLLDRQPEDWVFSMMAEVNKTRQEQQRN
jgi:hypothetical protein